MSSACGVQLACLEQMVNCFAGCTHASTFQPANDTWPPPSLVPCPAAGSGPAVRCEAPDQRGSPKVCSGGALVTSSIPSGPVTPTATDGGR